ncbi:MAG TPA: RodZ domain-containing protein [Syntrophomonadaceae bacterium]|nr:RodZ domain-containing protein [Syntrophomonadaceae bacterium]
MDIGEHFKEEREKQGYSLAEVEEETKIRKYYLEAIENNEYSVLPPKVYATGFVKRYAKFLGLNDQEYSEYFKLAAYGHEQTEDKIDLSTSRSKNLGGSISWKNVVVALVFLLVVVWVGNYLVTYFTKDHITPPNIVDSPIVEQPKDIDEEEDLPPKDITQPDEIDGVEIIIYANQNCWLNVVVDNNSEYNATLVAGEELKFTGTEKVYIHAGNAGGISITYNGEEIPEFGQVGEVKEATYTSY